LNGFPLGASFQDGAKIRCQVKLSGLSQYDMGQTFLWPLFSIGLVQGNITGHLHFSWEKPAWFPIKIFPHNNELSGPAQFLFCVLWVIPT
jgi:hypothetical protein